MRRRIATIAAWDWRYILTVVALAATMALPKLSRHSRKLHAGRLPAAMIVVGHVRPRRRFPATGPNRPSVVAAQRDQEQAVLNALRRVLRVTRTSGADTLKRGGLTAAQLAALQAMDCPEPVSMNEVARRTMTSASSASEVVSRLVSQGLVLRSRSRADGRSVHLTLTDSGRAAVAAASDPNSGLRSGLQRMALRDKRDLSRLLGQLLGKIDFPTEDDGQALPAEDHSPLELSDSQSV